MKKAVFGAALQHLLASLTCIVEEPWSQLSCRFQLEAGFAKNVIDKSGLANPHCQRSSHRSLDGINGSNCFGVDQIEIINLDVRNTMQEALGVFLDRNDVPLSMRDRPLRAQQGFVEKRRKGPFSQVQSTVP